MKFSTAFRKLYSLYSRRDNPMGKAVRIIREDPSLADGFVEEMKGILNNLKNDRLQLYVTLEGVLYVLTTLGRWNRVPDFLPIWMEYAPERGSLWWWAMKYYEAHLYLHTLNAPGLERLLEDPLLKDSVVREILYFNGRWEGKYICVPHDLEPAFTVYQEVTGIPCINVWGAINRFTDRDRVGTFDLARWLSFEGLLGRIGGGVILEEMRQKLIRKVGDAHAHLLAVYDNPRIKSYVDSISALEKMKLEVEALGITDEYYRHEFTIHFMRGTDVRGRVPHDVIRFVSRFRRDIYTVYMGILWRIGEISLYDLYLHSKETGTLGVFDHLLHLEKIPTNRVYLNFTGRLRISSGYIIVPTRETFLKTRSALVGFAYLLVFRRERPDLISAERFLERYSRSLYPLIYRRYGSDPRKLRLKIKKAIREDISRIQKVFREEKVADSMPLDLTSYSEVDGFPISNSNNFFSAARYGMVLVQEEEEWTEEFKDYAGRIRNAFLKDFVKNLG